MYYQKQVSVSQIGWKQENSWVRRSRDLRARRLWSWVFQGGGIIIAREIAKILDASLDIVLSRKLGAPGNPELAIGAVSEGGNFFIDNSSVKYLQISDSYIQNEKKHQMSEIAHRISLYRRFIPKINLEGRPVIVTDDGLATGATMKAALWMARQEKPSKLIAAIPVAPEKSLLKIADAADEILCLSTPEYFMAVGQFL